MEALLDGGADPEGAAGEALLNGEADPVRLAESLWSPTPLHWACANGTGPDCLTAKTNEAAPGTPLDFLRSRDYPEATVSIRQHILQSYASVVARRDGVVVEYLFSLNHSSWYLMNRNVKAEQKK